MFIVKGSQQYDEKDSEDKVRDLTLQVLSVIACCRHPHHLISDVYQLQESKGASLSLAVACPTAKRAF